MNASDDKSNPYSPSRSVSGSTSQTATAGADRATLARSADSDTRSIWPRHRGLISFAFLLICFGLLLYSATPDIDLAFIERFGFTAGDFWTGKNPWSALTYIFIHASFSHFLINGFVFFLFAHDTERALPRPAFAGMILTAAISGAAIISLNYYFGDGQIVPTVGMLPAVYAVFTFYTLRWPNRYVLLPFIKMKYAGGLYIFLGLFEATSAGGVIVGALCFLLFRGYRPPPRRGSSPYTK